MSEKALQKIKSMVPKRAAGQSVNFLRKDPHETNSLPYSCVSSWTHYSDLFPLSLPLSPVCLSQLIHSFFLGYEVCNKLLFSFLFFFFGLKARSHFTQKQVPLLQPYPCEWQPWKGMEASQLLPRTKPRPISWQTWAGSGENLPGQSLGCYHAEPPLALG